MFFLYKGIPCTPSSHWHVWGTSSFDGILMMCFLSSHPVLFSTMSRAPRQSFTIFQCMWSHMPSASPLVFGWCQWFSLGWCLWWRKNKPYLVSPKGCTLSTSEFQWRRIYNYGCRCGRFPHQLSLWWRRGKRVGQCIRERVLGVKVVDEVGRSPNPRCCRRISRKGWLVVD